MDRLSRSAEPSVIIHMSLNRSPFVCLALFVCAACVMTAGCEREDQQIHTYVAPKDPPEVKPVEWALPGGWREVRAGQMQFATFAVDPEHSDAAMSVLALPRESNELTPNVNRWEGQLGLPMSSPEAAQKLATHLDLDGGIHADVIDLSGTNQRSEQKEPQRLISAIVPHGTLTWFFTLKGPPEIVANQKGNFDAFVRSLKFKAGSDEPPDESHPQLAMAAGLAAAGATRDDHEHHEGDGHDHGPAAPVAEKVNWGALPAGWTEDPSPRTMRVHTLLVEEGGKKGEVIVTRFPQDGVGPLLQNINRWRGQVGLEPTDDPKSTPARDLVVFGERGAAFDMEGPAKDGQPAKRQIVAMTAQAGNFWFIRFVGPKELIDAQQKPFEKLLNDARFAGVDSVAPGAPPASAAIQPPSTQPSGSPR
jgi:hypothetical protein